MCGSLDEAVRLSEAALTAQLLLSAPFDRPIPARDDYTGSGCVDFERGVTFARRALLSEGMARGLEPAKGLLDRWSKGAMDAMRGEAALLFSDQAAYVDIEGLGWRPIEPLQDGAGNTADDPLLVLCALRNALTSAVGGAGTVAGAHHSVTLGLAQPTPAQVWLDAEGRIARMSHLVVPATRAHPRDLRATTELSDFGAPCVLPPLPAGFAGH